jgi:hypothetical protein
MRRTPIEEIQEIGLTARHEMDRVSEEYLQRTIEALKTKRR